MAVNDELVDGMVKNAIDIGRFENGVNSQVLNILNNLNKDLEKQIAAAQLKGPLSDRMVEMERLKARAEGSILSAYNDIKGVTHQELVTLAQWQSKVGSGAVSAALGVDLGSTGLNPTQLKKLANGDIVLGAPAKDWWNKQSTEARIGFRHELRMGILQGQTNEQIARRILGQPAGKQVVSVKGKTKVFTKYEGGIFQGKRREALALVRTSVQSVANATLWETYKEQQDVLQGVELIVTMDDRTTPLCRSLDGGAWDFDGNPLPLSTVQYAFPGPPPYHFQCRSILAPLTKSWDQLAKELKSERMAALKEMPESTKASMDGQIPGKMRYEDWLKSKPVEFQKEVLGPGRHKLWSEGKITMSQMVSPDLKPRTLAELHKVVTPAPPPPTTKVMTQSEWEASLTTQQKEVIEWWGARGFGEVREILHEGKTKYWTGATPESVKARVDALQSVLSTAPRYQGTMTRGMVLSEKRFNELFSGKGAIFESRLLTSWSTEKKVGEKFAYVGSKNALPGLPLGTRGTGVVLKVSNGSGVNIARLTGNAAEKEILAPTGQRFTIEKIVSKVSNGVPYKEVHLRYLDDAVPGMKPVVAPGTVPAAGQVAKAVDAAQQVVRPHVKYEIDTIEDRFWTGSAGSRYNDIARRLAVGQAPDMFALGEKAAWDGLTLAEREYLQQVAEKLKATNFDWYQNAWENTRAANEYQAIRWWSGGGNNEIRRYQDAAQHGKIHPELQPVAEKIRDLQSAVKGAPVWPGEKYRGVSMNDDDFKRTYVPGNIVEHRPLASWSSDRSTAHNFATPEAAGRVGVIFKTQGGQGVSIKNFSKYADELEVFAVPKQRFAVESVTFKQGWGSAKEDRWEVVLKFLADVE